MSLKSSNPKVGNRGEWFERKILHYGVSFRNILYNSDELMKLRQERCSLIVEVKLEKPDESAILVRVLRRKLILSVPAVMVEKCRRRVELEPTVGEKLASTPKMSKESALWEVAESAPNPYCSVMNNSRTGPSRKEHYDPIVLKICADAINEVYLSRTRGTIRATLDLARYRVLHRELYAEQDGTARVPESTRLPLPTRWLIQRLIYEIPEVDRYQARYGRQAALRKFR
jgi:putative transposase